MMKKYLVGGAVRNKLLKIPIKEKDWVVVGATPQEMLNVGYEQVGKNFPVFLHPDNHEEYALARTERKSGQGYTGFQIYTSPSITIEEDLYKRDLTINAMAYDMQGNLIDPYHGQKDIKLKILRHVSKAFTEDSLRVLRVARFAAQFAHIHFTIAPETIILMQQMVHELHLLSPERIWTETKKALITNNPQIYFQILRKCNALKILFPELNTLFNIPTIHKYQYRTKTINSGNYTMIALNKTAHLTNNLAVRFAILCHKIAIGTILNNKKIKNSDCKTTDLSLIDNFCHKLKTPKKIHHFSKNVAQYYEYLHNKNIITPEILMMLFKTFQCWQNPHIIKQMIDINQSYPLKHHKYNYNIHYKKHLLYISFVITKTINTENIINDGFTKSNISIELYRRRLNALKQWQYNNHIKYKKLLKNY